MSASANPAKRVLAGACIALFALSFGIYSEIGRHEFINFDDPAYITKNRHVASGLSWAGLRWALTATDEANWHPLTWLSHMADVEMFGMNPGAHHLMGVALHGANAALLLLALTFLTGEFGPSLAVAALFVAHPLRVESVAWAAERKDLLAALFFMLTLLAYGFYARRPGLKRYALVVASFACGLLAKPMVVTIPFVLLLIDVWPLVRHKRESLSVLVVEKIPLFALSAVSCAITLAVQRSAMISMERIPLPARAAYAVVGYAEYLGQSIWPSKLSVVYPHPALTGSGAGLLGAAVVAFVVLAAVTVVVATAYRTHPYLATGWFWYLGMLVPVIGLVQVGVQATADRYAYLPLIGIYIIAAWGLKSIAARFALPAWSTAAAVGVAVVAYAACSKIQVGVWSDSTTLFSHALAVTTNNDLAHQKLGEAFAASGRLADATSEYEKAIAINPGSVYTRYDLAVVLTQQGELDRARAEYERVLLAVPDNLDARNNFAALLARQGDLAGARSQYELLLRYRPDHAHAQHSLGLVEAAQNDLSGAQACFERALSLNPDDTEVLGDLAALFERQGRLPEAAERYEALARLQPDSPSVWFNLGDVAERLGDRSRAAAAYERALALRPGDPQATAALARVRSLTGTSPRAPGA